MTIECDQRVLPAFHSWFAGFDMDRPALVQQQRVLSHSALHGKANQIARYLRAAGIGAESKVGIMAERSIAFVEAALGILKSGAAYVALDPTYPEARLRFIAEDAGLSLILGAASPQEQASSWPSELIDLQAPEILAQPADPLPPVPLDPEQLAYVIYTSGSTGAAKGVEVTYANLDHLIRWHNDAFAVTALDRATLIANVGFDAAVWELWPYLVAGATLYIPEPELIRDPSALRAWVEQQRIHVMFAPTMLAEALLATPWPTAASLRFLLTGGDTLRITPQAGLPFRVINNYGPAEATVVTTSGEILPGAAQKTPSIGRPIAGARVFLLDEHLCEVEPGAPGEICIGGDGVARGYLNQPSTTAQRFVVHPQNGTRIYRSGDMGCWNQDGSLQFLGRMDDQVKVRGYRIECGEIEAALHRLSEVENCAVVLREQNDGHQGLTAFLVLREGAEPSRESLRDQLRLVLPEYMLPEQFVRVSHLPVSANNKIDRRKLPALSDATLIPSADQPASPIEAHLGTILCNLLKINQISRNDDFFLLGGHSFIAAQLIARIRDHFGVQLSLRTVFENPTPASMAEQIEHHMSQRA